MFEKLWRRVPSDEQKVVPIASSGPVPAFRAKSFVCPQCGAFSQQDWSSLRLGEFEKPPENYRDGIDDSLRSSWKVSLCLHCKVPTLWHDGVMVGDPRKWVGPEPNPDMPIAVQTPFNEARAVASISPRASAALLRRLLERILFDLGARTGGLDASLAWAKQTLGLPPKVYEAARTLKLMGDHGTHVGEVDLFDEPEAATSHAVGMMELVNLIVAHTSALDAQVSRMHKQASDAKAANRRSNGRT